MAVVRMTLSLLILGLYTGFALIVSTGGVIRSSRARPITATLSSWEDYQGCQVLRPAGAPRALLHWLGGVFVSPAPQVAYSYMLESFVDQGYLVVATPFAVDFDYCKPAAEVHHKFMAARAELSEEYGELPLMAAGHSLGALMQVLLCCLYPGYGQACAGSALVSYNNKPASDAIPLFEQAFVPAFAPLEPLTRNEALLGAKDAAVGFRQLSFTLARDVARVFPLTQLASKMDDNLDAALRDAELLAALTDQIPDVLAQISRGASEFRPSPTEVRQLLSESCRLDHSPLVVSFEIDGLDESDRLEDALAATVGARRVRLAGTHLTPLAARRLLVPSGLRPENLLFDVDGLVSEINRYFTQSIDELNAKRAATGDEASAQEASAQEARDMERGQMAQHAEEAEQAVEETVQPAMEAEDAAMEAEDATATQVSQENAVTAQRLEADAYARLEDAAQARATAREAEARAIVTFISGQVVPTSQATRDAMKAEAEAASEEVRAAKREEEMASDWANIASVAGRIGEIEASAEGGEDVLE